MSTQSNQPIEKLVWEKRVTGYKAQVITEFVRQGFETQNKLLQLLLPKVFLLHKEGLLTQTEIDKLFRENGAKQIGSVSFASDTDTRLIEEIKRLKRILTNPVFQTLERRLIKSISEGIKRLKQAGYSQSLFDSPQQLTLETVLQIPHLPKPKSDFVKYSLELPAVNKIRFEKDKMVIRLNEQYGPVYIKLPEFPRKPNVKVTSVRLVVVYEHVAVQVVYEQQAECKTEVNPEYWLALDLGFKNLVSGVSNHPKAPSLIIKGGDLISFVAWIEKQIAELDDQKLRWRLLGYRRRRMRSMFHKVAHTIVTYCLQYGIGRIVVGNGAGGSKIGSGCRRARKFNRVYNKIAHNEFIQILQSKAMKYGIHVKVVPEAYTSKLSALSDDITRFVQLKRKRKQVYVQITDKEGLKQIAKQHKRGIVKKGVRHHGLFKDGQLGKLLNADLNGALNIAKLAEFVTHNEIVSKLRVWLRKLCNALTIAFGWLYRIGSIDLISKGVAAHCRQQPKHGCNPPFVPT